MSLRFLPLPVYIAFCTLLGFILIYIAISRRKNDKKEFIVIYITLLSLIPFGLIGRIVPKYYDFTSLVNCVIFLILFLEITVIAIKNKKNNLMTTISLILIWAIVAFFTLIFLNVI
jgi:hypothetical membrane protein